MKKKKTTSALISICDEFATGIRSLAAFVEQYGYPTWLYFLGRYSGLAQVVSEQDVDCIVDAVASKSPAIIGLSVRTFYEETARTITKRLRDVSPDSLIIWGGSHPTILPDECIEYADAVCLGEGEKAFLDLLEAVEQDAWPIAIEGMWIRDGSKITKSSFRLPIQDLDSILLSQPGGGNKFLIEDGKINLYDGIPLGSMKRYGIRQYNIITSRGCQFSCSYCINSFLRKKYGRAGRVRRRSVEHVMAELDVVKDYADVISFEDDDFLGDREWIQAFLSRYVAEVALPFMCLATPVHVCDEGYLQELRRAGLVSINVGIQSGSERTQKIFRRPFEREHLVQIAEMCRKLGILPQFDLILNNPFEGESDVADTLDLLLDLQRPFRLNLFSLTFFPNYEITEMALEQGVIAVPDTGYTKLEDETGDYASDSPVNNLIYLTQVIFFPKPLIRFMANNQWVKAHPGFTKSLVRLMQSTLEGKALYLALLILRNPRTVFRLLFRRLALHFSDT